MYKVIWIEFNYYTSFAVILYTSKINLLYILICMSKTDFFLKVHSLFDNNYKAHLVSYIFALLTVLLLKYFNILHIIRISFCILCFENILIKIYYKHIFILKPFLCHLNERLTHILKIINCIIILYIYYHILCIYYSIIIFTILRKIYDSYLILLQSHFLIIIKHFYFYLSQLQHKYNYSHILNSAMSCSRTSDINLHLLFLYYYLYPLFGRIIIRPDCDNGT